MTDPTQQPRDEDERRDLDEPRTVNRPGDGNQPPSRPEKHPQRSDVTPRKAPDQSHRWSTDTEGPSSTAKADALGATVLAYLITGPALFGGLGYLLDRVLGTAFLVVVGVIGGMAASLYLIWLRYGTS